MTVPDFGGVEREARNQRAKRFESHLQRSSNGGGNYVSVDVNDDARA